MKKLTFVHKGCREGNCPTVYLTESGDLALQGDFVTDPEGLKDMPPHEAIVELPIGLVREALRLIDQRVR